jgi:putative ABC transport system permease protein
VAVSMMIMLTAVGLGLKENTIQEGSIDFWIVPADSDIIDPITDSTQTMLGDVHSEIETLFLDPGVKGATPILNKVVYASPNKDSEASAVMAVGVIPGAINVMPASASGFTQGDPYFYGTEWTGEAVINRQSADLMVIDVGDVVYINVSAHSLAASRPYKIVNIIETAEYSSYPVVILHLSELQQMTGNLENDRADQIVVEGPKAEPLLQQLYPDDLILSSSEYTKHRIVSDKRILATAAATSLISFILGILFIGTTMVISVSEREGEMAVMSAIGISRLSILKTLYYESVFLSVTGGILGVVLSVTGKVVLNSVLLQLVGISINPMSDPILLLGGLTVAVGSGICTGLSATLLIREPDLSRAF